MEANRRAHGFSANGWSSLATTALGALLGALVGAALVVGMTLVLKAGIDIVSGQAVWLLIGVPLVGLALTVLILEVFGRRTFPRGTIPADITSDVIATAGHEERFRWRLAPLRALAVFATVGFGGAMGTEAPAAYFGTAIGAWLGDRGRRWRRLLRPAALAGGAAGVAVLMGIALVGTGYMLELGRRQRAPLNAERLIAGLIGGTVGWGINVAFRLNLIRLIVPRQPPANFAHAAIIALFIGTLSGVITSLAGLAIYRAKKWQASPGLRLALGVLAAGLVAVTLAVIAAPSAAVGPGGGSIVWAENASALPMTLLAVALLRAAATIFAAAAGGCGGIFVPFLAIGDIGGRVFAPGLGVENDLAGAAGAAAGIAGGYRLPWTAIAMVLGLGGARLATLTCLATVGVAFLAGVGAETLLERLKAAGARLARRHSRTEVEP